LRRSARRQARPGGKAGGTFPPFPTLPTKADFPVKNRQNPVTMPFQEPVMRKYPGSAVLLIIALAIVPNFINFLSGAYIKKRETGIISLAATAAGTATGTAAAASTANSATAPAANAAAPVMAAPQTSGASAAAAPQTGGKTPFMAVPGRVIAESLAGRGLTAAQEIELGEIVRGSPSRQQNWQGRQNRMPETRGRPDGSNLTPDSGGGETFVPNFIYKIDRPLWHSSTTVILLHGSGANESTMMPFARPIWPRATLVGIRGRIMQGNERRWYHKITPTVFNQQEAEREAEQLARFVIDLSAKKHYRQQKLIFVGYSNGANILAIMAMKYPQLVQRAILLRPMPVLDPMPQGDLHNLRILTLSGARDKLYGGFAEPLYRALQQGGAHVTSYRIAATHMIGREDARLITRWLKLGY